MQMALMKVWAQRSYRMAMRRQSSSLPDMRSKQRDTEEEKRALREGRVPEDWVAQPAMLAQKDRDARWTVKRSKVKPAADGAKRVNIAVPMFGYKNPVGIDRRHGLICI